MGCPDPKPWAFVTPTPAAENRPGVQLVGYYMAALLVDHRWYGRRRMQMVGFLVIFVLYLIVACLYPTLTTSGGVKWFQTIFYVQVGFRGTFGH